MVWIGAEDFVLEDDGSAVGGLIIPSVGNTGVMLNTATHSSYVDVTLRLVDGPETGTFEEWEDVAVTYIDLPKPEIRVAPVAGLGEVGVLSLEAAGTYGVQALGLGRVGDHERQEMDAEERYEINVWPVEGPFESRSLKLTSPSGLEWDHISGSA